MGKSQTKQGAEMVRVVIWVAFADDPDGPLERLDGLLVAPHADQGVAQGQDRGARLVPIGIRGPAIVFDRLVRPARSSQHDSQVVVVDRAFGFQIGRLPERFSGVIVLSQGPLDLAQLVEGPVTFGIVPGRADQTPWPRP